MNPGLPIARQEPFLLYRSLFAVSPTEAKHRARAVHYFLVRSDRKVPVIAPRRGQGGRESKSSCWECFPADGWAMLRL